jgi:hypothetical protein
MIDESELCDLLQNFLNPGEDIRNEATLRFNEIASQQPDDVALILADVIESPVSHVVQTQAALGLRYLFRSGTLSSDVIFQLQPKLLSLLALPNLNMPTRNLIAFLISDYCAHNSNGFDIPWPDLLPALERMLHEPLWFVISFVNDLYLLFPREELFLLVKSAFSAVSDPNSAELAQMIKFQLIHFSIFPELLATELSDVLAQLFMLRGPDLSEGLNQLYSVFEKHSCEMNLEDLTGIFDFLIESSADESRDELDRIHCLCLLDEMCYLPKVFKEILTGRLDHLTSMFIVCLSNPKQFRNLYDEARQTFSHIKNILSDADFHRLMETIQGQTISNEYLCSFLLLFFTSKQSIEYALNWANSEDLDLSFNAVKALEKMVEWTNEFKGFLPRTLEVIANGLIGPLWNRFAKILSKLLQGNMVPLEAFQQFVSLAKEVLLRTRSPEALGLWAELCRKWHQSVDQTGTMEMLINLALSMLERYEISDFLIPVSECIHVLDEESRRQVLERIDYVNHPEYIRCPAFFSILEALGENLINIAFPPLMNFIVYQCSVDLTVEHVSAKFSWADEENEQIYVENGNGYDVYQRKEVAKLEAYMNIVAQVLERYQSVGRAVFLDVLESVRYLIRWTSVNDLQISATQVLSNLVESVVGNDSNWDREMIFFISGILDNSEELPIDSFSTLTRSLQKIIDAQKMSNDIVQRALESILNALVHLAHRLENEKLQNHYLDKWGEYQLYEFSEVAACFLETAIDLIPEFTITAFDELREVYPYFMDQSMVFLMKDFLVLSLVSVRVHVHTYPLPNTIASDLQYVITNSQNYEPTQHAIRSLESFADSEKDIGQIRETMQFIASLAQKNCSEITAAAITAFGELLEHNFDQLEPEFLDAFLEMIWSWKHDYLELHSWFEIILRIAIKLYGTQQNESLQKANELIEVLVNAHTEGNIDEYAWDEL